MKKLMYVVGLAASMMLLGCKGEKGDIGPAGTNGTNGNNGKDGSNGINGKDGNPNVQVASDVSFLGTSWVGFGTSGNIGRYLYQNISNERLIAFNPKLTNSFVDSCYTYGTILCYMQVTSSSLQQLPLTIPYSGYTRTFSFVVYKTNFGTSIDLKIEDSDLNPTPPSVVTVFKFVFIKGDPNARTEIPNFKSYEEVKQFYNLSEK